MRQMKTLQRSLQVLALGYVIIFTIGAVNHIKREQLRKCVDNSEGTDSDCYECYYSVYGEYPDDERN